MSEINYEWEIEYERCVREILSESMCVRGRESEKNCVLVCEREIL